MDGGDICMQEVNQASGQLTKSSFWSDTWVKHIERYLSAPPRCGIWMFNCFNLKGLSVLECAGGSCRDSRHLYDCGVNAEGSDFDQVTLDYLKNRFPNSMFQIAREDCFNFSKSDHSFDVTFHNGFWICFNLTDVVKLLIEQRRITRRTIIALVHNVENKKLVNDFEVRSKTDDLYKIKFFHRNELENIVSKSEINFKRLRVEKFGGIVDFGFKVEKKMPSLSRVVRFVVPRLYKFQPWSKVERIALIIDLE
jgi:hypothetical protein